MKPPFFREPGLRPNDFAVICLRVIVPARDADILEDIVVRNAVESEGAIGTENITRDALTSAEWDWLNEVLDLPDD